MINNKDFKKNIRNAKNQKGTFNNKSFFSLKNERNLQFGSQAEYLLMLVVEFDPMVDSYRQFEFKMIRIKSFNPLASDPGLIVDGDGQRNYIVLSNELDNEKLAQAACEQFQKSESRPISMTVVTPANIGNSLLAKNVEFLYQYALLPTCCEDFSTINDYLEFNAETSIKKLKFLVKNEAAVYQLLFHRALRADLDNDLIRNETIVSASPIIKSIIKNLEE